MSDAPIDLRPLPYMPLHIQRLQKSKAWLRCKRRPEMAFYLMNLWMRAWHEVPAGSIEDDDDVLADAAMCPPDEWDAIKAEVLRGWDCGDDGRWHHPVVAELATEAADKMRANRRRTEKARAAKAEDMSQARDDDAADLSSDSHVSVTEAVTGHEGKGREEKDSSLRSESPSLRSGEAPQKSARASRLPDDWQPPTEALAWATESHPLIDPALETEKFRDFWRAKPGKDGRKLDWLATWRNWIRNARPSQPARASPQGSLMDEVDRVCGFGGKAAPRDMGPVIEVEAER